MVCGSDVKGDVCSSFISFRSDIPSYCASSPNIQRLSDGSRERSNDVEFRGTFPKRIIDEESTLSQKAID
jgi:hypothetical protein